jgi:hypothetical protein
MSFPSNDVPVYVLGIFLGVASGWVQIKIHDLLFTALLMLASTLLLGGLRPPKPWRWAILFLLLVPTMQVIARFLLRQQPTRAEVLESLLLVIPAIVGSYGGAVLRRTVQNVWNNK